MGHATADRDVTDCNFRFLRKKRPSLKPASAWKGGCVIEHSK